MNDPRREVRRYEYLGSLPAVNGESVALNQCPDCGAAVSSLYRHDVWHERNDSEPSPNAALAADRAEVPGG